MEKLCSIKGSKLYFNGEELLKIESIKEAAVIDRDDDGGNKYLCAYFASEEQLDIEEMIIT